MTKYDGLFIRGPKHGERFVGENPIVEFPEMPEIPFYREPTSLVEQVDILTTHQYVWDDEYKYWVYVE